MRETRENKPADDNSSVIVSLIRLLDRRCVPIVTMCYFFALLDRSNLGAVKENISDDLSLSPLDYSTCSSVFFATYIPLSIPINMMVRKFGPRSVLTMLMIAFGSVGSCQALASDFQSLVIIRLALGMTEAGVYPAVVYFFTLWYTSEERARRLGYFSFASPISGAIGGIIAWAVLDAECKGAYFSGLKGWQVLFLIEGAPAVAIGFLAWFYLADTPSTTKFISQAQKRVAEERAPAESGSPPFDLSTLPGILKNTNNLLFSFLFFFSTNMTYLLSFYTPTIINKQVLQEKNSDPEECGGLARANLLTVPIYVFQAACLLLITRHSDLSGQRHVSCIGSALMAAVGFSMILLGDSYRDKTISYMGLFLASGGSQSLIPLCIAWLTDTLTNQAEIALASAVVVSLGNCGGITGPLIYGVVGDERKDPSGEPDYGIAHATTTCIALIAAVTSIVLWCRLGRKTNAAPIFLATSNGEEEKGCNEKSPLVGKTTRVAQTTI
eukprot:UC4_evm1s1088